MNVERYAENKRNAKPLTLNPFSNKQKFILEPAINAVTAPFRSTPENLLQRGLRTSQPSTPLPRIAPPNLLEEEIEALRRPR